MEVGYNFCKKAKLTLKDLLAWLDLEDLFDNDFATSYDFFGRYAMIIDQVLRISCPHKDFDKWSNSEEWWFDIDNMDDKHTLINWVEEQRGAEIK